MATLYWGGGTGTWDGFTTANWYSDLARTTLAGRAPAADDDVIFDSTSNATAYTVTIANDTTVCRNVTIAGPASGSLTLAGSGAWYIYGSITLPATGLTRTYTGTINFYGVGSHTITTNGVALASSISFNGIGTYTLQDALSTTNNLSFANGTFDSASKNITAAFIGSSTGTSAIVKFNASTISGTQFSDGFSTCSWNFGTSNLTLSSTAPIASNNTGVAFYNLTLSSTGISTCSFDSPNTFNNLTFTARSSPGLSLVVFGANQIVTGTLTIPGASSVNRYFIYSKLVGTPRTLTVGTVATLTDVDFRDITVAGASSPWSGTRLGNCGGNTNITFPAAKTVYWNQVAGGNWYDTAWATGSGGTAAAANFPLAQDTAIINDTGLNTATTITSSIQYNVKTITSTKTNAYTLSISPIIYGDLTLTASTTATALSATFAGRATQNLTSAGNTLGTTTLVGYNASVLLADNLTIGTITITSGGLNTNSKSLTVTTGVTVSTTNTGAFTLTLGSSAVSIAGSAGLGSSSTSAPTMTVSAGTSSIDLTAAGAVTFGFAGQTLTWYNVVPYSSQGINLYGNNTFNNFSFNSASNTGVAPFLLYGNQTINGTFALSGGASVIKRMGIYSDTAGTQRTITAAAITGLSNIDFRDIKGAGTANWTTGTSLGDCGGNSGITFTAAKTVYWNLAGSVNWSDTGWATGSGGTPAANNFPLAQDTAVFDDTGSVGTVTINASWNIGTISAGGRTSAWTLGGSAAPVIYGSITYGSGITASFSGTYTFRGNGTQTFTTAGKSLASALVINKPSGTFQHGGAYTSTSSVAITITAGTYTTQNYNISATNFNSNNSNTRSITFGTSTLTFSGSTFSFATSTGLTFSGASSTINLSSTSAKTFAGGGQTFGTVSSTGGTTDALTISGNNKFGTLTNSAYTYMIWTAGTTQEITTFSYTGAAGNVVRWYTNIPGQRATIKTASSAVGANSTNGGNNSGLTFTGSSPNYFYVKDIAAPSASANFLMFFM